MLVVVLLVTAAVVTVATWSSGRAAVAARCCSVFVSFFVEVVFFAFWNLNEQREVIKFYKNKIFL